MAVVSGWNRSRVKALPFCLPSPLKEKNRRGKEDTALSLFVIDYPLHSHYHVIDTEGLSYEIIGADRQRLGANGHGDGFITQESKLQSEYLSDAGLVTTMRTGFLRVFFVCTEHKIQFILQSIELFRREKLLVDIEYHLSFTFVRPQNVHPQTFLGRIPDLICCVNVIVPRNTNEAVSPGTAYISGSAVFKRIPCFRVKSLISS
jgi:hypothetical protein